MKRIKEIFRQNHERYGYRRITAQLHKEGYNINHKKVLRLMRRMNLCGIISKRRRYNSYKGKIGKIAPNLVNRSFDASQPGQKLYTDVTEFHLNGEKLYLSPIIDGYYQEVVAYNLSTSPNLNQIMKMLDQLYAIKTDWDGCIMHSDQGWQYQHFAFQRSIKNHGMKQSMSRKGNSLDNGLIENFFQLLKKEMFYGFKESFKDINALKNAIHKYITYYNNDRIKIKLKGLSPVEIRQQSFD